MDAKKENIRMARLPIPGGDNGNWGDILNDYLLQTLKPDGTLKDNSVTSSVIADDSVNAAAIQDGSITEIQLNSAVQTKLNSKTRADWNTLENKPAVIAAGADQTSARSAIGAGTSNLAIGTTSTTAKAGDYRPASVDISDSTTTGRALLTSANAGAAKTTLALTKSDVGLGNVDNTSDTNKPVSSATQTALNGKLNTPTGTPDGTKFLRDDNSWQAVPASTDATTSSKGVIQLAGDLSGTAAEPRIADNAVTSEKIADGTIVATDISASADIARTQLASDVQTSLAKADTALQSGASGGGSVSGFPLRLPGEKMVAVAQEVADARIASVSPTGSKVLVLAEAWDKPGILKHIWIAAGNTYDKDGFLEQGGVIRIYTDDTATPAISMSLGDFFCVSNHSGTFSTPRVGRTSRGTQGEASAYRYLYMPFRKYLRVEVENLTNANSIFYGQADYSTINSFDDLGSQQLAYSIQGQRVGNQAVQSPMTVCDFDGSGQIESFWVSFSGASSGDSIVLEGNVEIYIDGETMPSWTSSGGEDAFNGGWYSIPIGGYPAGRSGDSDQTGTNISMYRFLVDDPVFFNSHLKIVAWAGQPNQGTVSSSTVDFAAYAGIWSDTPVTPNYTVVDVEAAAIDNNHMDQAAGAIDTDAWSQPSDKTQMTATGSTFGVSYGSTSADQDVRLGRKNVTLPSDYWVETGVRITDGSNDGQEAHLIVLGASPDPWYGSAVHLQLRRYSQNSWGISVRDDFDTVFATTIGGGRDLTNVWTRLAVRKIGTNLTVYYSLNAAPAQWIPIGSWAPSKTGTGFGVGTWTAGAEFDYLAVRPLKTVTS